MSPRDTADCIWKGMGKRVHQHYPDHSIKIYYPGLTREKMLNELLVVKGRSGQQCQQVPNHRVRRASWWCDEPCASGVGTEPGSSPRRRGGWDKAALPWERRGWVRKQWRSLQHSTHSRMLSACLMLGHSGSPCSAVSPPAVVAGSCCRCSLLRLTSHFGFRVKPATSHPRLLNYCPLLWAALLFYCVKPFPFLPHKFSVRVMQEQLQERPRKTRLMNLREDMEKTALSLASVLRKAVREKHKSPMVQKG